jgi:hypothetical protein
MSNIVGWRTNRKIVVIESDDWGSIRTRSKEDYDSMTRAGLELNRSNFTRFDCLESNSDLSNLFEVLSKHKDKNGNTAVFTPLCIVANPDFEKIRASNFQEYHYEPFPVTCNRYPRHDKVHALWKEGITNRLFVPEFHGREHLNVYKWMKALKNGNEGIHLAFRHHTIGASVFRGEPLPEYLAAFDPETRNEIDSYPAIIKTGAKLFKEICGYSPRYFIASNSPEPKSLEGVIKEEGVKFLCRYKLHRYPLGNRKFSYELNWLGRKNKLGQTILTRNCGFEPSDASISDWVDSCLVEVNNAFRWQKPAIISSHRVNYVSFIEPKNAYDGLKALDKLLVTIRQKWPDVEFMTSIELGELITSPKTQN